MSHFSVMVRLPSQTNDIDAAITEALAPYCEHENGGRSSRFMQFEDTEDESRKKYETESTTRVRMPDGSLVLPFDDRFRTEVGGLFNSPYVVPDHLEKIEVPFRETYSTFEQYMSDWEGEERDPGKHRYGSWRNPNAKWDWYQIGGRYANNLFTASRAVNMCRIRELNYLAIENKKRADVAKFWGEVDQLLSGHNFPTFDGPREILLNLGILDCKDEDELAGGEFWKSKWDQQRRPGIDRYDVIAVKPDVEKLGQLINAWHNPIRTYAFLDAARQRWSSRGEMGWFGMSHGEVAEVHAYMLHFNAMLAEGDQDDRIVVVDCHI